MLKHKKKAAKRTSTQEPRRQDNSTMMEFWGHLDELRGRLLKALIALVITTTASFGFSEQLVNLLARPIGGTGNLQSIEVTENISVFMRVSLLSGFTLALPIILYQLLAFVLPGLNKNERRWVLLAIPAASLLFIAGVVFTYLVMLPAAVSFLINFMGIETTPSLLSYMKFILNMLFWIGVCFEMPLVVFVLAKLKLVTARQLAKQWRIAVVAIAVLAAVVSPTVDPINMALLMLPLLALYGISVLLAILAR